MPQINRIRVNNVKYNFGTQFYDDFLMRFSCKNSIYDLANGGGKSVLMLLLLQNMIPNCTLDDKQPIEKMFRNGMGNTVIHSLVEWKLDACDIRNGYRYMTTGFCARKAKESDEVERKSETAAIEYFNYCIFYKEFGENDIKNLPLSNGSERITYNGLKSYLRDLEKRDFGVEVKIFDRKGDYQNFISEYGLFESQWEIIRGINKTEGHVRTYFESNYKTTRKIIEDLLIEGIIEKSYNNRIRKGEEDDSQMAETLLEIKDKLMELAKRKEEIDSYDEQIKLLEDFSNRILAFKSLFEDKKNTEEELIKYLTICKSKLVHEKEKNAELDNRKSELQSDLEVKKRNVAAGEIELEMVELDKLKALIEETTATLDTLIKDEEQLKEELKYKEAAADYFEYEDSLKKYSELKEFLNSKDTDENQATLELAELAATKNKFVEEKKATLGIALEQLEKLCSSQAEELETLESKKMELFSEKSRHEGFIAELESETEEDTKKLDDMLSNTELIAASGAESKAAEIKEKIEKAGINADKYESLKSETEEKIQAIRQKITETDAKLSLTGEEIDRNKNDLLVSREKYETFENIKRVYNEASVAELITRISDLLHSLAGDIAKAKADKKSLMAYEKCLSDGEVPEYEEGFNQVVNYLKNRYEGITTGRELIMSKEPAERLSLMRENPSMYYCVFVGNSYEEIKKDKALLRLNTGSQVVPIFKDMDFDAPLMACHDMTFIFEENGSKSELLKLAEDIAKVTDSLKRMEDKYAVMEQDLFEVRLVEKYESPDIVEKKITDLKEAYEKLSNEKNDSILELDAAREKIKTYAAGVLQEKETALRLNKEYEIINSICTAGKLLEDKYAKIKEAKKQLSESSRNYSIVLSKYENLVFESDRSRKEKQTKEEELKRITEDFEINYRPFFKENVMPIAISEEELDSKAGALRMVIKKEMGEMADKEKLLAAYSATMKKCEDNLKYNGLSIAAAREAGAKGLLTEATIAEKLELKNKISRLENKVDEIKQSLLSEQTQMSRIEGSIWHGQKLYEEKYGEFERIEIAEPNSFILGAKQEISDITAKILAADKEIKALMEANKDILLMEKDLERIVKNAGLTVPENVSAEYENETVTEEAYEGALKKYDALRRDEQKKRNTFADEKQKLVNTLNALKAYELANEFGISLIAPENIADVETSVNGIKETCDCIGLERNGIEQGIKDMQKIKESFEERCIQICSNIRAELERLPKLSRISLDDEIISMITLSIPFIKEELYKDRMSVYINETVSCAETIASTEEKLKYIKSQLSWKKLFSVIVTDMNSIKLCLYKREHIKDQSRYLKYEEAVGSTGQSQGIYIQFLIAIIHYISNINGAGRDVSGSGKTIFIDNPFGAAKDVYIWEPIFKLLKTNHVQLIVPARGVTPAISKMFDVNYILGQKMIGDRQQTVVCDYRSQANMDEMDYDVLEYTQATLNLD